MRGLRSGLRLPNAGQDRHQQEGRRRRDAPGDVVSARSVRVGSAAASTAPAASRTDRRTRAGLHCTGDGAGGQRHQTLQRRSLTLGADHTFLSANQLLELVPALTTAVVVYGHGFSLAEPSIGVKWGGEPSRGCIIVGPPRRAPTPRLSFHRAVPSVKSELDEGCDADS